MSLSALTAAPHDAPPAAFLGELHARMLEAVTADGGELAPAAAEIVRLAALVALTARDLHPVAARLERLLALTGLDPTRHEDRERLGVGLKAHAVLAAFSVISH